MEGLVLYERSILPHGQPSWMALDPDMEGYFEAKPVIDHAQAAIEREQKANENPEPGTQWDVYYSPDAVEGEPDEDGS